MREPSTPKNVTFLFPDGTDVGFWTLITPEVFCDFSFAKTPFVTLKEHPSHYLQISSFVLLNSKSSQQEPWHWNFTQGKRDIHWKALVRRPDVTHSLLGILLISKGKIWNIHLHMIPGHMYFGGKLGRDWEKCFEKLFIFFGKNGILNDCTELCILFDYGFWLLWSGR
jgi:hypothetical protein